MTDTAPRLRAHDDGPVLVWQLDPPRLAVASSPLGGGIGRRAWVVNAQVPRSYARTDVVDHLGAIARAQGCRGAGVGMLTAASVETVAAASDGGVDVYATVGVTLPTWAADAPEAPAPRQPGTINVVAFVPARLAPGALVNAVMTVTEAKTQALLDAGVPGTGTASDAVCVLTALGGPAHPFGGPRSELGAPLARATYEAVRARAEARP
jgi:adenosylcobinamide amidohydrolase